MEMSGETSPQSDAARVKNRTLERMRAHTQYASQIPFPESDALDCDCRQRSHDRGGGPSEEAITPEISSIRRSAFWKLAAVPLKTVQAAGRAAINLLALTSRTCTVCTVLESKAMRNRKYAFDCGETVQDDSCLWKEAENRRQMSSVEALHSGLSCFAIFETWDRERRSQQSVYGCATPPDVPSRSQQVSLGV
jgi:hypothetical protein